ncbi:MAG: molybdopterin cofactor-binding domain-containing protein [Bryobacteraceae bacterium]
MTEELFEVERYELREPPAYLFSVSRREFLGTVGAGFLIVAVAGEAQGQRQSAGSTLEARLHIGEDGVITILNGKIEEGQGPRTEFAMAAAEELRVPVERIRMVMADTDATPNDGGTSGSRSTPGTVPLIRQAASAARGLLITIAAAQWGIPRERVHVDGGTASGPDASRKLTYQDLAKSAELTEAYSQPLPADVSLTAARDWKVLGQPRHRVNGRDIVTGAHKFPSDIERPGMLYGSVLRPPSFGAALVSVNLDKSKSMPGVTAVRDGDFVACAASSSFGARKAIEALAATAVWKEKQHPSSDTLFRHLKEHGQAAASGGRNRPRIEGDVERALAGAQKRLKAVYQASYVQHAPMEPRAAVAEWQDGKLTVWTGTSNPFNVRQQLAEAFRIPAPRVRVIAPDFGGGFGGKHTGEAALEAARLAREANRPVSVCWTRAEEFTWAYCRPAALIEIDSALDDKNEILAWDFANYNSGGSAIDTPYRTANSRIRFIASDSPLRQGSYRALASTANNFARESMMDELAEAAGAEPLEFRLAHLENGRIREVLTAATNKFQWAERSKQRRANRGVGLACGTEKNSVVAACVEVEVDSQTGVPRLLEICQAFECGTILNPAGLKAQVEGCILMGLAALREEMLFAGGRIRNPRFSSYRVPRFRDVPPKMEIILVDKKEAEPVGAGETPIIAVAPAMGNAIFAATGRRVRSLPFQTTQKAG